MDANTKQGQVPNLLTYIVSLLFAYRKVASSGLSRLVAQLRIFRLFMKGKFDGYVLWFLAQRVQNWIVDQFTARDFTVGKVIFNMYIIMP